MDIKITFYAFIMSKRTFLNYVLSNFSVNLNKGNYKIDDMLPFMV